MLLTMLSYLLPAIGLIAIGSIIILKDSYQRLNRIFFLLTITIAVWLIVLFVADLKISHDISLAALRIASMLGILMAVPVLYLGYEFPVRLNKPPKLFHVFAVVPTVLFIGTSLLFPFVPDVDISGSSAQPVGAGLAYTVASLYVVLSFVVAFIIMLRKRKAIHARQRAQISLMVTGMVAAVAVNVITGLLFTVLNISNSFSNFAGSLSWLLFVGATAYAIVRYRLFDIRMAVARTIGYALTLGLIATLYSLFLVTVSTRLISVGTFGPLELFVLVIPTIFVALTFHNVKQFVIRHAQRVFYQDAYDDRDVLEDLYDVLIADTNIDSLMKRSSQVLELALKPANVYIAVLDTSGSIYHHYSSRRSQPADIKTLLTRLAKSSGGLIEAQRHPSAAISRQMLKNDVEVLLRLGTRNNPCGYLMLGPKINGRMYTKQDITLLGAVAKKLGTAFDNAKKYEQILHFADTLHKQAGQAADHLRKGATKQPPPDISKNDIVSNLTYQLRTPTTTVHDALDVLNSPAVHTTERDALLVRAEANSQHMVIAARTMLSMARLQTGHYTIERTDCELVSLTQKVIEQSSVLAAQKDINIVYKKPPRLIPAKVDYAKISEALANYLDNAIRYSPDSTLITVRLATKSNTATCEVIDQGIGVPEIERKNLFSKFFRAANSRRVHPDGNGIGLYVVQAIAKGHGGEAYYRPSPDGGSVFGLKIATSR